MKIIILLLITILSTNTEAKKIGPFVGQCNPWQKRLNPNELVREYSATSVKSHLKSNFRMIGGHCLHYVEAGSKDAQDTIVLLHGYPEFWYSWHKFIDPLVEKGYRVVMPDMLGAGQSERPDHLNSYSQMELASDVATLIQSLGIKKAHVISYDTGGMTGWYLTAYFPEVLKKSIIVNFPHPSIYRKYLIEGSRRERNYRQFVRSFFVYAQSYMPELAHDFFLKKGLFLPLRLLDRQRTSFEVLFERLNFEMRLGAMTGVNDNSISEREIELYTSTLLEGKSKSHNGVKDWFKMFGQWGAEKQVIHTSENKLKIIVCSTIQREREFGLWQDRFLDQKLAILESLLGRSTCEHIPDGLPNGQFSFPKINVPVKMVWGTKDAYLNTDFMTNTYEYLPLLEDSKKFEIVKLIGVSHWVLEQTPEEVMKVVRSFLK